MCVLFFSVSYAVRGEDMMNIFHPLLDHIVHNFPIGHASNLTVYSEGNHVISLPQVARIVLLGSTQLTFLYHNRYSVEMLRYTTMYSYEML